MDLLKNLDNMITAEKLLIKYRRGDDAVESYNVERLMIEFAKLHVEAALKEASEEVCHDIQIDWCDPYDYSAGHNGIKGDIDKKSILNAYPLENIK